MKKLFLILTLFFINSANAAEIYRFDPSHTNIVWSANHFGFSSPSGKFTKSEGSIIFDSLNPQESSVEITIDTSSIETGDREFNNHITGVDFLDAARYPTAKFVSNKILLTGAKTAKITGNLTLHGVTKSVVLETRMNKLALNPFTQKKTMGISVATIIKRSDFNIDYGIPGISDEVKIKIEAEATMSSKEEKKAEVKDDKQIVYEPNPDWKIVKQDSVIGFKAKQGKSVVNGSFKEFNGKIKFNKDEQKGNQVTIEVDTSSLAMSFSQALDTIKTDPWLAVQKFPKAVFTADNFTALSSSKMQLNEGQLTIKGKTIPVSFGFEFTKYTKTNATAIGSFTVKRSDFGIGSKDQNDVDEEVEILFKISAQR